MRKLFGSKRLAPKGSERIRGGLSNFQPASPVKSPLRFGSWGKSLFRQTPEVLSGGFDLKAQNPVNVKRGTGQIRSLLGRSDALRGIPGVRKAGGGSRKR
jgi:hypothetical protein